MNSELVQLHRASAHAMPMVESESVQVCVTSPPYFGLRKYDGEQEIDWPAVRYSPMAGLPEIEIPAQRAALGNESTIEAYIAHLILCTREWRRVLRDDGTCFVNLGDSYAAADTGGKHGYSDGRANRDKRGRAGKPTGIPSKNRLMIPARFALAMQADGWILRDEWVWHKPNPMPESVTDRATKAHEMIYVFSKRERYFWDAAAVKEKGGDGSTRWGGATMKVDTPKAFGGDAVIGQKANRPLRTFEYDGTRNLRSVLTVATQPYAAAHFAVWPAALVEPMIKAGTSERGCCPACGTPWRRVIDKVDGKPIGEDNPAHPFKAFTGEQQITYGWAQGCDCPAHEPVPCVVLDPFSGSGTTLRVAVKLGRRGIGVDLSEEYLTELTPDRLTVQMELIG